MMRLARPPPTGLFTLLTGSRLTPAGNGFLQRSVLCLAAPRTGEQAGPRQGSSIGSRSYGRTSRDSTDRDEGFGSREPRYNQDRYSGSSRDSRDRDYGRDRDGGRDREYGRDRPSRDGPGAGRDYGSSRSSGYDRPPASGSRPGPGRSMDRDRDHGRDDNSNHSNGSSSYRDRDFDRRSRGSPSSSSPYSARRSAPDRPAAADSSDTDMLPHRRAAAARKAEQAAAAAAAKPASASTGQQGGEEEQYPTFVPRNPGVTDGVWDAADDAILKTALVDAEASVTPKRIDASGFVLLGKSLEELEALCEHYKQPKYRAKQLMEKVLQGARSLEEVTTVPAAWRAQLLADGVRTGRSILQHQVESPCGTRKFLLQLADGRVVETVGIPADKDPANYPTGGEGKEGSETERTGGGRNRLTVCVSSQVGCPMRCSFCATGKGGFARNLTPHEIMDQVLTVQEQFGKRVSNVVFMGMGEPLLNLPSVVAAYQLLNTQLGIGARYITVSTVGVPNAIPRLARASLKSTLAVSIHAPNQALRESIIPSAKAYPIQALMEDCATYYRITGRRVTFEYTLLSGVNDGIDHARELAGLLRAHDLLSHVNVIPWNPVDESEFKRPSRNSVMRFVRELEAAGLAATIRMTRGLEAAAACGQLRNRHQKEPMAEFAVPA